MIKSQIQVKNPKNTPRRVINRRRKVTVRLQIGLKCQIQIQTSAGVLTSACCMHLQLNSLTRVPYRSSAPKDANSSQKLSRLFRTPIRKPNPTYCLELLLISAGMAVPEDH